MFLIKKWFRSYFRKKDENIHKQRSCLDLNKNIYENRRLKKRKQKLMEGRQTDKINYRADVRRSCSSANIKIIIWQFRNATSNLCLTFYSISIFLINNNIKYKHTHTNKHIRTQTLESNKKMFCRFLEQNLSIIFVKFIR